MKDGPRKYPEIAEELVRRFEYLQEQRVKTYKTFEEGNKSYLSSGPDYDFLTYREVVNNVTHSFKQISEDIIGVERKLRQENVTDIADLVSSIQDCEKRKLELTVEHHLARQMVQDSEGDLEKTTERNIRQKLGEVVEDINDNLSEIRYIIYESDV